MTLTQPGQHHQTRIHQEDIEIAYLIAKNGIQRGNKAHGHGMKNETIKIKILMKFHEK